MTWVGEKIWEWTPETGDLVERWNAFVAQVDSYRACINLYLALHYAQADAHRSAADAAVQAWNDFVRENLNVPEDFPHELATPATDVDSADRR